jgi:hypothetical protein
MYPGTSLAMYAVNTTHVHFSLLMKTCSTLERDHGRASCKKSPLSVGHLVFNCAYSESFI